MESRIKGFIKLIQDVHEIKIDPVALLNGAINNYLCGNPKNQDKEFVTNLRELYIIANNSKNIHTIDAKPDTVFGTDFEKEMQLDEEPKIDGSIQDLQQSVIEHPKFDAQWLTNDLIEANSFKSFIENRNINRQEQPAPQVDLVKPDNKEPSVVEVVQPQSLPQPQPQPQPQPAQNSARGRGRANPF